ncbi:hypothetical protein Nepgr_002123 [Nepenthes gracilis]|uniref:RRM domain-containing protein n=1 Tax=Nepenthes gracilis TaxID=150966 RepID=A0AAD3P5N4_NEPGR|nr:hypothetical protein Nepgr_002123 [Nepenthes gracilis]
MDTPTEETTPMLTSRAEPYFTTPSAHELVQRLLYEASQFHYPVYLPVSPYAARMSPSRPAMMAFVEYDYAAFLAWPYFWGIPNAVAGGLHLLPGPSHFKQIPGETVEASDFSNGRKAVMIEELLADNPVAADRLHRDSCRDVKNGFHDAGSRRRRVSRFSYPASKELSRTSSVNDRVYIKGPSGKSSALVWRRKFDSFSVGDSTSLMIRNIPNRVSRRELIELLDKHCREENESAESRSDPIHSEFDFLYLPIDFATGLNYGFAFVNFTNTVGASRFCYSWTGKKWDKCGYNSKKIRQITFAYIQGRENLKMHFKRSVFFCQTAEYLPVEFIPPRNGLILTQPMAIGTRRDRPASQSVSFSPLSSELC